MVHNINQTHKKSDEYEKDIVNSSQPRLNYILRGTCVGIRKYVYMGNDASCWMPYSMIFQPADDGSIYKSQIFASKCEVVHGVKTFSIKSHQQYFVYKSTKSLLKLKLTLIIGPIIDHHIQHLLLDQDWIFFHHAIYMVESMRFSNPSKT